MEKGGYRQGINEVICAGTLSLAWI